MSKHNSTNESEKDLAIEKAEHEARQVGKLSDALFSIPSVSVALIGAAAIKQVRRVTRVNRGVYDFSRSDFSFTITLHQNQIHATRRRTRFTLTVVAGLCIFMRGNACLVVSLYQNSKFACKRNFRRRFYSGNSRFDAGSVGL